MSDGTKNNSNTTRLALADATSGVLASLISMALIYPMDSYKTRIQAGAKSTIHTSSLLFQPSNYYHGIGSKAAHVTTSNFAYFFLYSWLSSSVKKKTTKQTSFQRLLTSAIAAMMNTMLTLPLDVISSRKQVQTTTTTTTNKNKTNNDSLQQEQTQKCKLHFNHHEEKKIETDDTTNNKKDEMEKKNENEETKNVTSSSENCYSAKCEKDIVVSQSNYSLFHQITDLWSGLVPSLLLCSNPSIHFTVYETLKDILSSSPKNNKQTSNNGQLTMSQAFQLGFISKFIATILTYPLIRAKVIIMTQQKQKTIQQGSSSSLRQTFQNILQTEGIMGFYKGCSLQLLQTIFKSALLMMFRERITTITRTLFLPDRNNSTTK